MSEPTNINDPPPSYEFAVNNDNSNGTANRANSTPESVRPRGSQVYIHPLRIAPSTHRSELAYPTDWAPSHDVSARDWTTFVARLFSGAAEGRMDEKRLSDERIRHIEGVVREWNRDFFQPRAVLIKWEGESRGLNASGSSSTAEPFNPGNRAQNYPPHSPHAHPPPRPPPQHQPGPSQLPARSSLSTKHRLANKIKNAAKERDVSVTSSKIRVGDAFSLDALTGNVKIGKLSLTDKGMNYDGRPIGPQAPPPMHPPGHGHPPPRPYGSPHRHGGGYHPPYGPPHHGYGPGGPAPYPGGYGPPRHSESWGSSPMSPPPGPYGRPSPHHSHTWGGPVHPPHGPPHGPHGHRPPPHHAPWAPHESHRNSPFQGQASGHPEQTSGTTW